MMHIHTTRSLPIIRQDDGDDDNDDLRPSVEFFIMSLVVSTDCILENTIGPFYQMSTTAQQSYCFCKTLIIYC